MAFGFEVGSDVGFFVGLALGLGEDVGFNFGLVVRFKVGSDKSTSAWKSDLQLAGTLDQTWASMLDYNLELTSV